MSYVNQSYFRGLMVVVAVMAAMVIGAATATALPTSRNGKSVTAVKTVTETTQTGTSSQTFSNVPGMSATVGVPDGQKALLVITFSGSTQCADHSPETDDGYCYIRVLVDRTAAAPGEVRFDAAEDGNGWEANSFQWVISGLGPGQHTVTVQHRVDDIESTVSMTAKTLTVLRSVQ